MILIFHNYQYMVQCESKKNHIYYVSKIHSYIMKIKIRSIHNRFNKNVDGLKIIFIFEKCPLITIVTDRNYEM